MNKESIMYIEILLNSLEKKEQLLNKILDITKDQEIILNDAFDLDAFDTTMEEKEKLIDQIEQLDLGFETVYERVKEELVIHKQQHQPSIVKMQASITKLTQLSAKLQTLELNNKIKLENCMVNQRQKIRTSKTSSSTAASYYKNMANQHQGQSYFLDKKK